MREFNPSYFLHIAPRFALKLKTVLFYVITVVRSGRVVAEKAEFRTFLAQIWQQTGSKVTLLIVGVMGNARCVVSPVFMVPNIWSVLSKAVQVWKDLHGLHPHSYHQRLKVHGSPPDQVEFSGTNDQCWWFLKPGINTIRLFFLITTERAGGVDQRSMTDVCC